MSNKKRKLRTDFRKNRTVRTRDKDARRHLDDPSGGDDQLRSERISGKGSISRRRTVAGEVVEDDSGTSVALDIDPTICRLGRVLRVQGLVNLVRDAEGNILHCATRRLLKTMSTDQRHVVVAGDIVWFRPEG
jgi:ribosome biogenesis GTPase